MSADNAPPDQPGGLRARQKAETGQLILEAAKDLFAELGFEKTTIRGVASRAGVGVGTVLSHFPDKASLLIAALLEDLAAVQAKTLAGLDPRQPLKEQLLFIVRAFFAYYARRPDLSRTLLKEALFIGGPWGARMQEDALAFVAQVAQMIEAAKQRGEIRPQADAQLAAASLFSYYLMVLYQGLAQPVFSPRPLLGLLSGMVDQLLAGIGPLT